MIWVIAIVILLIVCFVAWLERERIDGHRWLSFGMYGAVTAEEYEAIMEMYREKLVSPEEARIMLGIGEL